MANKYPMSKTSPTYRYYSYSTDSWNGTTHTRNNGAFYGKSVDSVFLGGSPSNWRKIIASGGDAGTTLVGVRYKVKAHYGTYFDVWQNGVYHYGEGCMINPHVRIPTPNTAISTEADNIARAKLLESYINARNTWRGANFAIECGETISMMRHAVHHLYDSTVNFVAKVHSLKKVWRKSPRQYGGALSNAWLSYSFGWKPLFEDIRDANKAVANLGAPRHDSLPIKGHGYHDGIVSHGNVELGNYPCGGLVLVADRNNKTQADVKYYGAVIARPEGIAQVAEDFGFDPDDILPAIWEGIPWSFLVDYFVNVQEVLDSMRYMHASLGWLMRGIKNTVTNTTSVPWCKPSQVLPTVSYSPGVSAEILSATYLERGSMPGLPYPSFRTKIPGLGSLKWLNVDALLAQILASRPTASRPRRPPSI
jgi:hypothetical protein